MPQFEVLPSSSLVLHVWPGDWNLPTIDPSCLAAILYLQCVAPGAFSISTCTNPDLSASGQLPFLTHEQHVTSPLPAIIKYVSGLRRPASSTLDLDARLSNAQRAQSTAWCNYVESNIGDLVYTTLYSISSNWAELTHPTLVSLFPIPQCYFVPGRLRSCYKPRLESAGLWTLAPSESEPKKPFSRGADPENEPKSKTFLRAYERQKVLDKARDSLGIFDRLLGDKPYFYHEKPTTLDVVLAAHILFLVNPTYPDRFLQDYVMVSYPSLVAHAQRVYGAAMSTPLPVSTPVPSGYNLWSLVPKFPIGNKSRPARNQEDVQFDRIRWGFFGLAIGSVVAYFATVGSPIRLIVDVPKGVALPESQGREKETGKGANTVGDNNE
ncbi:hypothetical protein BDN72DRAFT_808740 [Pluteus cervinus]|uniref:Uncharacterized protein n=1 Tax=Pluteus cervinus TaxID=181527 RepID=A0ACD3BF20_9AGAR|nr:hypothetical protein BDN72DRAFT_808740 [Pluteus cervinus]